MGVTYEGPKGPGMQEMLYPHILKHATLEGVCAHHRRSLFGRNIRSFHRAYFARTAVGNIALVRDGDYIDIDIQAEHIYAYKQPGACCREKRNSPKAKGTIKPKPRDREVSKALRSYAAFVSSADLGAVRII